MGSSTLEWVGTAALGCVAGGLYVVVAKDAVDHRRFVSKLRRRSRRALTVATDASLNQDAFDPAVILAAVDEILNIATGLWIGGVEVPEDRSDGVLIDRWARSLVGNRGPGLCLTRSRVDVLGVVNREGESEDRVDLRVRLRFELPRAWRRSLGEPRSADVEGRWTMGRTGNNWRLLIIDDGALIDGVLSAPLIPAAWADEDRLWEDALAELADSDAAHGHVSLRDIVSAQAPVVDQLREISEVDRRFGPDLLLARLKRIVVMWEESSPGSEDLFSDVAAEGAVDMLLHGPARPEPLRLIVRDMRLESWTPVAVELSAAPQIHIAVIVSAVRHVVWDSSGEWAAGSRAARHHIAMDWTLTLHREPHARWELTSSTNPITARLDPDNSDEDTPAVNERAAGRHGFLRQFSAANQAAYSEPPPQNGQWTGRADQAPLQMWLRRRLAPKRFDP